MFKVGVTDLLEDYRITGGISFPLSLNGSEYMLSFENLRNDSISNLFFTGRRLKIQLTVYT